MDAATGDYDGDLWAQEALKFAQAGLEAVQHLRERKSAAPPPPAPAPSAPAEPLLRGSDFKGVEAKADEPKANDDPMARDADGDLGALARIDDADDYVRFEGASSSSEDEEEEEGGGGTSKKKATYIKLPEIRGVGLSGVRDIDMDDVRQQAMLAQLRRREANYLDTVRSLNITNLQMHAREFARTRIQDNTKCEIHAWSPPDGEDQTTKINLTGSLEFLDTEEERAMFHTLDAAPWLDKFTEDGKWIEKKKDLPKWAKSCLEALEKWLKEAGSDEVKGKKENTFVLDMNEFVEWTYLYRFMNVAEVAESLNTLVNYLMPNGMFASTEVGFDPTDFAWFSKRKKFLEELDKIMPSSAQMMSFEKASEDRPRLKTSLDAIRQYFTAGLTDEVKNVLSYTWNYVFFLLFYRQVIVHEFFMFCTWKKFTAPNLEGVDSETQKKVNQEDSLDDIMHTYYSTVLNKYNLFRDVLMGAKDPFTFHLQQYLTLSHERVRVSHERNMRRSEDVVYNIATGKGQISKTNTFENINKLLEEKFFDNRPRKLPADSDAGTTEIVPEVERTSWFQWFFGG